MSDIRTVKYLVGIDFGDGETTASVISFDDQGRSLPVRSLNIFDQSTPDRQKVESCIYQRSDGEWDLASTDDHFSKPSLKTNFKNKPSDLQEQEKRIIEQGLPECEKKVFQLTTFVRLVFERILANNTDLEYSPETQEKNFYLVVACPSKWAKDPLVPEIEDYSEINAYKALLNTVIPVDAVIKESDAAFFHFLDQKLFPTDNFEALVIDYGSSTIDYTRVCIQNGKKDVQSDGSNKRDLGASKVEAMLQEHLETSSKTKDDFQSAIEKWNELCKLYGKYDLFWEPSIRHNLKQAKEGYFGSHLSEMVIYKPLISIWPAKDKTGKLPKDCCFYNTSLSPIEIEDENSGCLKHYKEAVRLELKRIAAKWSPDYIVITGGASRMRWVKDEVEKAFPNKNVQVDKETPSYVVSHGIVKYLLHLKEFYETFDPIRQDFISSLELNQSAIIKVVNLALTESVRPLLANRVDSICSDYSENNLSSTSFECFANALDNCGSVFYSEITNLQMKQINKTICGKLQEWLLPLIEDQIRASFKDSFSMSLIMPITIDYSQFVDQGHLIEMYGDHNVRKCVIRALPIKEWLFGIDMKGERDDSSRKELAKVVSAMYNKELVITVHESAIQSFISEIRKSVDLCFDNARMQIPFTIY